MKEIQRVQLIIRKSKTDPEKVKNEASGSATISVNFDRQCHVNVEEILRCRFLVPGMVMNFKKCA